MISFVNRIKSEYIHVGIMRLFFKILRTILRRLTSFSYSKYLFLSLNLNDYNGVLVKDEYCEIEKLSLDDFLNGDKSYFTENKLLIYEKWLTDGSHIPYGIKENGMLIYSAWISLKYLYLMGGELLLNDNEGLLLDDYCHKDYRGRGFHSLVTPFRLNQMKEIGKEFAVVSILVGNIPAYKVMIKSGFAVVKINIKLSFVGRSWFFNKDIKE
jgi:hypothetical protein